MIVPLTAIICLLLTSVLAAKKKAPFQDKPLTVFPKRQDRVTEPQASATVQISQPSQPKAAEIESKPIAMRAAKRGTIL